MKKLKKRCLLLMSLFIAALLTSGCGNVRNMLKDHKQEETSVDSRTAYHIYYMNNEETKLKAVSYQFEATSEEAMIDECLDALKQMPNDKNYKPVIASPIEIERHDYDKSSKTLSLFFSKGYNDMSSGAEMLVRAAIVKTTTQFSGIVDYVSFNIDGEWMKDSDGIVLRMKDSDYVIEVTNNLDRLEDGFFSVFFVSEDGKKLVKNEVSVKYDTTSSTAAVILDAIIRGPVQNNARPSISSNTQVKNVYVKNGICQIDFNKGFLEKIDGQAYALTVYSVVNSLCQLEDIDKVQITVDGSTVTEMQDGVALDGYLIPKKELEE